VVETVLNQQASRLDPSKGTIRQNRQLMRITGVILFLVMIAMTIYVLNFQNQNFNILSKSTDLALIAGDHAATNYRSYVRKYKETKIELFEATRKLAVVNRQLDLVTAQLALANGKLSHDQAQDARFNQDLQAQIQVLKDKDSQVSSQISELKNQLRAFDAQFSNLEEGRSLIALFKNKIGLIKSRMRYLKHEAFIAKVAAQKEKDRLALLNGNIGYVMRNGLVQNPNGTNKSFTIIVKNVE
jgi:hypothetical protein